MKRTKMLGVTLLEVMLVLAVAAMIIVMSIRYYRAATLSQQVNSTMATLQAIAAAADNLAVGTGSYSEVTDDKLKSILGATGMKSVSNEDIEVSSPGATTYTLSVPLGSADVCNAVQAKLSGNFSGSCNGATLSSKYNSAGATTTPTAPATP